MQSPSADAAAVAADLKLVFPATVEEEEAVEEVVVVVVVAAVTIDYRRQIKCCG